MSQALIVDEDVLTGDILQKALDLDQIVKDIEINDGTVHTFSTLCFKAGPYCLENSILEAWDWDESTIDALTDQEIKDKVNEEPLLRSVNGPI